MTIREQSFCLIRMTPTNQWNNLTHVFSKTANILFTKDFVNQIDDIVLSNIEADAGICLGMGIETDIGKVHIEAITRMDIIGVQYKNKKIRIGHDGRSALNIGSGLVSVGPQSDTFETFDGRADDPEHKFFDNRLILWKGKSFCNRISLQCVYFFFRYIYRCC